MRNKTMKLRMRNFKLGAKVHMLWEQKKRKMTEYSIARRDDLGFDTSKVRKDILRDVKRINRKLDRLNRSIVRNKMKLGEYGIAMQGWMNNNSLQGI